METRGCLVKAASFFRERINIVCAALCVFSPTFENFMSSYFLAYKNSKIHYTQWGDGKKCLLCLHGFGETLESFTALAEYLQEEYTVTGIDLAFHGKTDWREGLNFSVDDLLQIIDQIPALENRNFSLLGYSMGGRVSLQLYEYAPERVERLILLAPDGLKVNFWYWLATQSNPGNRLFRYFMRNPGLFFTVTTFLRKIGMINTGVYNYVHQYLQQEKKRTELYTIWTAMRSIKPSVSSVQKLILARKTSVLLIYGRYDRVIKYSTGEAFKHKVDNYCLLYILPCGHRILHEKNTEAIVSLLSNPI